MMPTTSPFLTFRVIDRDDEVLSDTQGWSAYLKRDQWDDWAKYCTQFYLTVVDQDGEHHGIGQIKIGQRGLKPHGSSTKLPSRHRKPSVPSAFEQLDDDFFSVGQDDDYYANLGALGDIAREQVLTCLRDVAWDNARWEWAKDEDVMGESLLRSITRSTVDGQFRRMAHGAWRCARDKL